MYFQLTSDNKVIASAASEAVTMELNSSSRAYVSNDFPGKPFVVEVVTANAKWYIDMGDPETLTNWITCIKLVIGRPPTPYSL